MPEKVGAKGLMIIPRVLSRGSSAAAQRAHFEGVLEAANGLPSVIYNSPYYGFETKADLFFELRRKYKHLVGFKEFGGAAALRYAAEHIAGADPDVMLTVGVDTQVVHGFVNCGAVGAITGIGNVLPREVLQLVALSKKAARGDAEARRQAQELDRALGVLSSFDEGPDLVLFYKHLMVLEGNPEYELHFCATDALSASQKRYAEKPTEAVQGLVPRLVEDRGVIASMRVIDSHTEGEPTRLIVEGGPASGIRAARGATQALRRAVRPLSQLRRERAARL